MKEADDASFSCLLLSGTGWRDRASGTALVWPGRWRSSKSYSASRDAQRASLALCGAIEHNHFKLHGQFQQ